MPQKVLFSERSFQEIRIHFLHTTQVRLLLLVNNGPQLDYLSNPILADRFEKDYRRVVWPTTSCFCVCTNHGMFRFASNHLMTNLVKPGDLYMVYHWALCRKSFIPEEWCRIPTWLDKHTESRISHCKFNCRWHGWFVRLRGLGCTKEVGPNRLLVIGHCNAAHNNSSDFSNNSVLTAWNLHPPVVWMYQGNWNLVWFSMVEFEEDGPFNPFPRWRIHLYGTDLPFYDEIRPNQFVNSHETYPSSDCCVTSVDRLSFTVNIVTGLETIVESCVDQSFVEKRSKY